MSFANDMLSLRHEIDSMHAARMAMMHKMSRFRAEVRKSVARSMSERHREFPDLCFRARSARNEFVAENHRMVSAMLGAFGAERSAGHDNFFMGKRG